MTAEKRKPVHISNHNQNKFFLTTTTSASSLPSSSLSLPDYRFHKEGSVEMDANIENEKNNNLAKEWLQKAANELNENAEIRKIRIKELRHMLLTAATTKNTTNSTTINTTIFIPNGRIDDAFLLRFLRAKKFDVEKAFKMILKYYSMKEQSPELFKVSPASQLYDLLKMQIQYMVPIRDCNGRKLYIFRVKKCDPYKCDVETVFRTNVLALENAVREPETQIGGLIVLLDMAGAGLGHAKFLAPHLAKKTVEVVQEAFPLRFKAFHILNEPFYFDAILAVLKPFLKEKIRRRIYTHGNNLSSLHKYISPDILPFEYGGLLPKFDNSLWRKSLMDDENYFKRLENFNYDYKNTQLKDSGVEITNELDKINGNHLDNEINFDDEKTMSIDITSANNNESITPTDLENDIAFSIPLTKNPIHYSSSDNDESDYELCEEFSYSSITKSIGEKSRSKQQLENNDIIVKNNVLEEES